MTVDTIIVGGGSAGCVIASRLSEDPHHRTLLIEAGPDFATTSTMPADVLDASQPTVDHDWGYTSDTELDRGFAVPRARIMGGCSATNACFAQRGALEDYDRWAELGIDGWSSADVLSTFRQLESDTDFVDPWHGSEGPVPMRRHPSSELNAVQSAFIAGAMALGHARVDDHNRPGAVGVGPSPRTIRGSMRMSTALTYLQMARSRPNLTIRPDTMVASLHLVGTRARGVRLLDGTVIDADRVVVCAGAYGSPSLLHRSGIGPARILESVGIPSVLDLPGVGANLSDHALLAIDLPTRPERSPSRFAVHATARSTVVDPTDPPDLMLFTAGPFDVDPAQIGSGAVFGLVVGLMAPRSRGWVRPQSSNPTDPPRIHFGHLRDPRDLHAMVDGLLEARRIAATHEMAAVRAGAELSPGDRAADDDRDALAQWALQEVSTFHHPAGTCAMGTEPDLGAVTDSRGSVHGVEGLTIADASIMPVVPTGTPNVPTIMVAERVARWLATA